MVQFKGILKGELARFFANSVLSHSCENPYRFCSAILLGMQLLTGSVADPECLSRISDRDFYPSRIPDPRSQIPDPRSNNSKKRGGGRGNCCPTFFSSHKYHKIKNQVFLFLNWYRKKFGPIYKAL